MNTRTQTRIAALSLGVALLATGCTQQTSEERPADAAPPTPQATVSAPPVEFATEAPTEAPTVEPSQTPEPEVTEGETLESQLAQFGDSWDYDDGISVTVVAVGPAIATDTAAGAEATGGEMVLFDVTITNNSKAIFDPSMVYTTVNYASTTAEQVFDSAAGIMPTFEGKILPGGSLTERQAYAIPTSVPNDVLFSVSPSWDHDESLFFGALNGGLAV